MKLLDTTVAIDHLRGAQAAVDLLTALVESDETVAASEVVRFELTAGVRDDELSALELLTTSVRHFPMLAGLQPPY